MILTQETVSAHGVEVHVLVVRDPAISGPWSVTGLHADGRRFVAVSEGSDEDAIARRVRDAALAVYDDRDRWTFIPTDPDAPRESGECVECGSRITRPLAETIPDNWSGIWTDTTGATVCPGSGHSHQPKHSHTYRSDLSDWWCVDCDTVTDHCQQINPL